MIQKKSKRLEEIIQRDVLGNQTCLVEQMRNNANIGAEPCINNGDIVNWEILSDKTAREYGYATLQEAEEYEAEKTVFEWWLISDWLARTIASLGGIVVYSHYGVWWGREEMGQSLKLDYWLKKVVDNTMIF